MSNPNVEYAEPNYIRKISIHEVIPNDLPISGTSGRYETPDNMHTEPQGADIRCD